MLGRKQHREGGDDLQRFLRKSIAFILLLIICFNIFVLASADDFSVKRIGNLIPFNDNVFTINAPEKGRLKIKVHDGISVYRTIEQEINKGETAIHWDGCAYNHEKLSPKNYTITAELFGASGQEYCVSFNTPVEYTGQCLQYLLPSSDHVSYANPDEWFVEFRTVQKGIVIFLFQDAESETDERSYSVNTTGGKINRLSFNELTNKNPLPVGEYHVTSYETGKPEEKYEFDLTVQEESYEKKEVFLTGEILPEAGMSEEEIWRIMQQPSVVIDIDPFKHQKVYSEKNKESTSLGTLHGQTQALKVMQLDEEWAFIGAWNHEEAEYIEGWVPVSVLKVAEPNPDYGILINKQEQKLDVYYKGKRIDTLEVSTGRPEEKHPEQETAAGSFLTGLHRVDFSMNGKKYDYVIQYDGGNLLHQIPYEWGKNKKDFSVGRSYLGAKASHACIRIQSEPGANGVNAYWIWTHIPYHTRVIILDDPSERRPVEEYPKIIDEIPGPAENTVSLILSEENTDEEKNELVYTKELKGHLWGFAVCSEKEYIRNPATISERINELLEKKCERIILKCLWSDRNAQNHTAVQEAMARKWVKDGADLVIGYGNKSFLGCEWRGNALILYGLGDPTVNRTVKQKGYYLTAEVIFDLELDEKKPIVILKTDQAGSETDLQQIIDRFIDDSIGTGISQICFFRENQS